MFLNYLIVREERAEKYFRHKSARREPWWRGGRRAYYVAPNLRYDYMGGREKEGEDNKLDRGKKTKKRCS